MENQSEREGSLPDAEVEKKFAPGQKVRVPKTGGEPREATLVRARQVRDSKGEMVDGFASVFEEDGQRLTKNVTLDELRELNP